MKNYILIIALLALWPGYVHAQINQDTVNSDVPGGGGSGSGLTESDIDTPAKLNAFVTPDLADISGSQTFTNKTIDAAANTIKILKGTDCTTFDAAVDGQYCWDTDDDLLYVCETADVCDTSDEWDAVASAGGDLTGGTLDDGELCVYNLSGGVIDCNVPTSTFEAAGVTAAEVTNTPAGNIAATDVQAAIDELDTEKQAAGTYATNSFTTMNAPSGTDPVADSASDTLNLTVNSPGIGISGDSSTDTLQFQIIYTNTLAGNPTLGQNACIFSNEGNGGGFLCEGSTNDNVENLFLFPDLGTSDNTRTIALTPTSFSAGNCAEFDSSGQVVDSGGECGGGGGGSAITLDLGDDGGDDSTDLGEIAITGDTNSIFTEPANDKLLIDVSNNWPTADSADDLDCTGCVGDSELASTFLKSADIDTFSELDTIVADETLVNTNDAQTLENKTISGADNTLSNIPWASLTGVPAFRKTLVQLSPRGAALPASSFATPNSRNSIPTLRFNGNVAAFWCFVLPNTYGGNGTTVEFWVVSTETSNDTDWDVAWARMEAEDLDTSNPYASAISADNNNNNATSGIPTKVSVAFTDGAQMDSCAAGEFCCVRITRDDTADTGGADTIDYVMGDIKETP